ncbi:MAG: hypothetical protein ACOYM3_26325 [Terrimicrobiaceae bacterium]
MKTSPVLLPALIVATLFVFPLELARAAKPVALELTKSGNIIISSDGLSDMEMRIEVMDTSTGGWKRLFPKDKILPNAGSSIDRLGLYAFPDGSEITHTVKAKIEGQSVQVAADWTPTSQAKGFSRVDLWLPQDIAQDVTITLGDRQIFPLAEGEKPGFIKNTDSLVFKQKSTWNVLFELTGDFAGVVPPYILADKPELGVTLRIANVPDDMHCSIGDATQLSWTMAFKP